jgi:hypothetical protein
MNKTTRPLLAGAIAFALSGAALAQAPSLTPPGGALARLAAPSDEVAAPDTLPEPLPAAPDVAVGGGVLQALPRPRDLPASLFAPPPPPPPGLLRVDAPYFVRDPLLDFTPSARPGWFGGVEIQVLKPHLIPGLSNVVQPGKFLSNLPNSGPPRGDQRTVALPAAHLDWTVSPRVFLGYRLPSGFGEFQISYRHLGSVGSGSAPGANGAVGLNSRLAFDIIDVDYNSRELSLGPNWDMKWTFGLRSLFLFFDGLGDRPFGQASAGSGIFQARDYNNLFGMGPHAALELTRLLGDSGWSLHVRGDFAGTFDDVHEGFLARFATPGPNGRPPVGVTRVYGHQAAPIINGRAGVTWEPSPSSGTRLFLGYQYEVFWDLDRVPQSTGSAAVPPSLGQLWDQGIVLQATINY